MHKKFLKRIAVALAGVLIVSNLSTTVIPSQAAESVSGENGYETTYQLGELTKESSWSVEITPEENGKTSLTFAASDSENPAYGEAVYSIPQEVLDAGLLGYTRNTASEIGYLALKYRDDERNEKQVGYGKNVLTVSGEDTAEFTKIGIMSTSKAAYSLTVDSITFRTLKSVSTSGEETDTPGDTEKTPSADPSVREYAASQLNLHSRWNPGTTVDPTLTFTGNYQEYCLDLPEAVACDNIESVTVKVSEQTGTLCFKFYDTVQNNSENVEETAVSYGNVGKTEYTFTAVGSGTLASIGIMSHVAEDTYPFTAKIESVSLKLKAEVSDQPSEPDVTSDQVYTDITFYNRWNSSDTCTKTITFEEKWKEYCFDLKKAVNADNCLGIKVKFAEATGALAFKVYDASKNELKAYYGNSGQAEYTLTPDFSGKAAGFAIMATDEAEANYPYSVTVESVTFLMDGETEEQMGDNLIANPNFADAEGLDVWSEAKGSAVISTCTSESDVIQELAGVKTYGKISGRTSNYDCFAQDITAKVENNKDYQYTFYVMLDGEDYKDAPAEQRTVEVSPIKTVDGDTSYSQDVAGDVKKVLEPGVWTKFTGTLSPSWAKDSRLEKLVLRILEQGTNYGQGEGVKGTYYVTGVELRQLITPEKEIQTDIPDLWSEVQKEMGEDFIMGTSICNSDLTDELTMQLVTKHFNAITLGNELKPDAMFGYASTCPETETVTLNGQELVVPKMDFSRAEKTLNYILDWNQNHPENQIRVRGHVLVWHSQTPEWFFHVDYDKDKDYVDKDTMNLRLEWYIKTVAEHFTGSDSKYKDMFYGWDVVNEAVSDGRGTYRNDSENSSWWAVYQSNEFILNAFVYANRYMPASVELYYNDYNEWFTSKVNGIVQLLKDVKATEGARIDGMGMQGHYQTSGTPTPEEFEKAARAYHAVVGKVQITELDFKATSDYDGTKKTQAAEFAKLAERYKAIYDCIRRLNEEGILADNITVWGVIDKNSWLQTSGNVGGASDGTRKQCPLLFDDDYQAKEAYWVFIDPEKLTPAIHKLSVVQAEDSFAYGIEQSFERKGVEVAFTPVWNGNSISVQVKVADATKDAEDKVTLYLSDGKGNIVSAEAARTAGRELGDGYTVVVTKEMADTLQVASNVSFDLVITDGNEQIAYNDTTLSHAESDSYFAIATLKPYLAIDKGTIVVDGTVDAAWETAEAIPLTIRLGAKADAVAKLLWNDDSISILVQVKDSVLNSDSANAHEKDSVEIFIDENNHKSASYEEDDKQYRINYLNEQSFNGQKCVAENIQSAVNLTEEGYLIEAALKWTDITPAVGMQIGLELQINDADASGKRIGTLSWYDESGKGWSSSEVFGTAVLKDSKAAPTPEPKPTPEPDPTPESGSAEKEDSAAETEMNWQQVESVVQQKVSEVITNTNSENVNLNFVSIGETKISQKLLSSIAGKKLTVAFQSGNGVALSISGQDLDRNSQNNLPVVDFTINGNANAIPEAVVSQKGAIEKRQITVRDTGSFHIPVNMHVSVKKENAGKYANLYRFNQVTGNLEYCSSFRVTENGQSMFALRRGGDYLVTVTNQMPVEKIQFNDGAYTVKKGDSLSALAARYHISLAELIRRNPQIVNPNRIKVGEKLTIN